MDESKIPDNNETPSEEDKYWFDRLDSSYDKGYSQEENEKAIEYFHAKKEFPKYLLTPEKSFDLKRFPKSMWEDHLKVLVKWIKREEIKDYFCSYIDDPNWPGYQYAYDTLLNLVSGSLPSIERAIESQKNDPDVLERLHELKEDIEEKEKIKLSIHKKK